ncbi:MAG: alpha/beta fold hydrolase [Myxococcota bacterium]
MHRESTITTGPRGLGLRCCHFGRGGTRPLVLLHGFLEQGLSWRLVAPFLRRASIAPDQRGFGLSDHIGAGGGYHFWDYVGDLTALVDHVGGPIDLVGHSMGGTIAALFAATRPDAVRTLVLVEGLGPPDSRAMAVPRAAKFLAERLTPPTHRSLRDLEDATSRIRRWNPQLSQSFARDLAARVTRPIREGDPQVRFPATGSLRWTWDPLHRGKSPTPFDSVLFRTMLHHITAPTLLVDGARSNYIPEDRAERQAAIPTVERVLVDDAGHMVHYDAPERLGRLILGHVGD